jgi:hypothetical protein
LHVAVLADRVDGTGGVEELRGVLGPGGRQDGIHRGGKRAGEGAKDFGLGIDEGLNFLRAACLTCVLA